MELDPETVEDAEITEPVGDEEVLIDEEDMTPEDALAVIMSATPTRQTAKVRIAAREGMGAIVLTIKSLTNRELKALRQRAQEPVGNRKDKRDGKTEMNDDMFINLLVLAAVHEPKLASQEVMKALGVTAPEAVVEKLFLPGVVSSISEKVMKLSGFDEDSVMDVGNS